MINKFVGKNISLFVSSINNPLKLAPIFKQMHAYFFATNLNQKNMNADNQKTHQKELFSKNKAYREQKDPLRS